MNAVGQRSENAGTRAALAVRLCVVIALLTMLGGSVAVGVTPPGAAPSSEGKTSEGDVSTGSLIPTSSSGWANLTANYTVGPAPRTGAAFAWDAKLGYDVLFGGLGGSGNPLLSTWSYTPGSGAGSGWKLITQGGGGPPADAGYAAAYDSTSREVDLFAGYSAQGTAGCSGGTTGQIWTFTSNGWYQAAGGFHGTCRSNGAMADDPPSGGMVVFGGCAAWQSGYGSACQSVLGDTWNYSANSSNWAEDFVHVHPSARWGTALAWDPATGQVVLFGGVSLNGTGGSYQAQSDTWTYSAGVWSNVTSTAGTPPSPRGDASLVFDPVGQRLLLFGGCDQWGSATSADGCASALGDTWQFQGGHWSELFPPAPRPSPRSELALATGSSTGPVVLWGGATNSSVTNDTWAWEGAAPPPHLTASASVQGSPTDTGRPVSFLAQATGGVPGYSFTWRFGDGASSGTQNATHAFVLPGTYPVRLWVNDSAGESAALEVNATVHPLPSVLASASPDPVAPGEPVAFSSAVTGGTPSFGVLWRFGDGSSSTLANATHAYTQAGTYAARLWVNDSVGASASTVVSISVSASPPLVLHLWAVPSTAEVGQWVTVESAVLNASGSVGYTWTLNGTGSLPNTTASVGLQLAHGGTYTVGATALNGPALASAGVTFSVNSPPATGPLTITATTNSSQVRVGSSVLLTAIVSGGVPPLLPVTWTLNGSTELPLSGSPVVLTLDHGGSYSFTASVSDSAGHTAQSASVEVTVAGASSGAGGGGGSGGGGGGSGAPSGAPPTSGSAGPLFGLSWLAGLLLLAIVAVAFAAVVGGLRRARARRSAMGVPASVYPAAMGPRAPDPDAIAPLVGPPPPGYFEGVTWGRPRTEWGDDPTATYGSYQLEPVDSPSPPVPPEAGGALPWSVRVSPTGIGVEKSGAIEAGPPVDPKSGTPGNPSEEPLPPVTRDHVYAVLQALDRKPRDADALRQVVRLEDYWLLSVLSALDHAHLIESGTDEATGRTVFALTHVGRETARRGSEEVGLGHATDQVTRTPAVAPEGPGNAAPLALTLEAGARMEDVRTIGRERGSLEEESPFGALRPEDVNPQLKGSKPLPKAVLQPMEMRVSQDRGTTSRDTTPSANPDERARELLLRARKEKEERKRARWGVMRTVRPDDEERRGP